MRICCGGVGLGRRRVSDKKLMQRRGPAQAMHRRQKLTALKGTPVDVKNMLRNLIVRGVQRRRV